MSSVLIPPLRKKKHPRRNTKSLREISKRLVFDSNDLSVDLCEATPETIPVGRYYNADGIDQYGYDMDGFNQQGFDQSGYDRDGYDCSGYDRSGYDRSGYDREGYDRDGFDERGYDYYGYNRRGYDCYGHYIGDDDYCFLTRRRLSRRHW